MKETSLNRRSFLFRIPAVFTGLMLLPSRTPAASRKPRPSGTCGGWVDADGDGCCQRSQRENGCGDKNCPGHAENARRKQIAEKGAPKGVCAQWEDSKERGFCERSAEDDSPCIYTVCPAHANHA